ncbi:MAG TPA: POTRA domain-containing protein [Myxococcales bacterium]|nr:POTRA domain-containing protein [Myxococcales bacterium]
MGRRLRLLPLLVALVAVPAQARIGDEPLPPWAQPQAGEPVRVGQVVFEGTDAKELRALVPVEDGAPLDARAVRDAVRALHASGRFARVAAYIEPLPRELYRSGWTRAVRLVFAVSPVQKLVSVTFRGQRALAESQLHQIANLQVNAEFIEEPVARAADAILAAYNRIGYRRASITPIRTVTKDGVALEMRIDEGPATRIAEVRFDGDVALRRDELLAAFKLRPGDVLNLSALDDGVRGVRERYRRAGRLRAVVESPILEDVPPAGARVIVPVQAGPVVKFHMRGNAAFPDSLLIAQLGLSAPTAGEDEPVDAQMAQEMAARLRRFYVGQGFLRARVAEREITTRDGTVELVFSIDEDRPVRVEQLVFTGNQQFTNRQLGERVLQQLRDAVVSDPAAGADPWAVDATQVAGRIPEPRRPRTRTEPETVFDPVPYARALKQIEDLYKSQGYLSVRAGPPRPEAIKGDPHRLRVTIPIAEGEQTRVSRILIEGGGDVPARELDGAIALRKGEPFSYFLAEEGRAALTQIFTRRGHLYARVEDEESFDENAEPGQEFARVEVRYRIQPGPVVRVAFVEVVGQRKTQESLVLDLINLKQGDVLTPEVLDRGQQALLRTGIFFSATLTPRNPEVAESEKTIQVQLRERPTKDFQATMGFSLADGPRVGVQWTQGNLLGRGLTFSAVAKADFPFLRPPYSTTTCPEVLSPTSQCVTQFHAPDDPIERVVDLGLSAPRLWPITDKLRAGLDLIHERALRPSYSLTKYSAQASVDLAKNRPIAAGLQYEVGYQSFGTFPTPADALADVDPRIFRLPPGQMIFGSLRPSVALDLRDDPARPRSGIFIQASGDYFRAFQASGFAPPRLVKLQAIAAGYIPLPFLSSLMLSARGGRIYQLDSNSHTPGDRSFYLGGATSLRGFHEDAVQPQDVVEELHREVQFCQGTLTGIACTPQALAAIAGGSSSGGDEFIAFTAELRLSMSPSLELALFYDAGNLWATPTYRFFKTLVLRDAVGFGLRWLTPIGRVAIDLGINLSPDPLFNEPRIGPYFAIDPL